ncbi:MAG TPA: TIGR00282 family metallophosphoesterase [Fusobacteria bacterium]|nr:TIGR00282 family metallophosphoesterase [Fusobacteriota bacterium]|tara:strand:+ start:4127 stop:4897 length:771 start_codon:yes stop_codon:yes gene_type:complete
MKVLCIGDIYSSEGVEITIKFVEKVRQDYDLIVANGENASSGFGIKPKAADSLFDVGVDVITSGNHIWDKRDIYPYLDSNSRILRPHNFPEQNPGKGYVKLEINGESVLVLNLQGTVFMNQTVDPPFRVAEDIIAEMGCKNVILDFHAEATSEKMALAKFLDGKISIFYGTHTHVQTNDAQILPLGTGYCTDIGMTGPHSGIIGVDKGAVISRFLTSMPHRFQPCNESVMLHGISSELEDGKCKKIDLIKICESDL